MPKTKEPETIANCPCGAPAVFETRNGLRHKYAIHCSNRATGSHRTRAEGCNLMPPVYARTVVGVKVAWNRAVVGATATQTVSAGVRCPRCSLLEPHQCIVATPYRSRGIGAELALRGRVAA